jgi:hypothetical protein
MSACGESEHRQTTGQKDPLPTGVDPRNAGCSLDRPGLRVEPRDALQDRGTGEDRLGFRTAGVGENPEG